MRTDRMQQPDVVIFGGGAAGLWLLDELVRLGRTALLLESGRLGSGQTIAAQGIIHGGLKYSLSGARTAAAEEVREMPALWRRCLAGERQPDLRDVRSRADACYLWRGRSLGSRLGYLGARLGLEVTPQPIDDSQRPESLAEHVGPVARLAEPVIDPVSLVETLACRHHERLLAYERQRITFSLSGPGEVASLVVSHPWDRLPGASLRLQPGAVVLAAGAGNAGLRRELGLEADAMQRRPLHMVMVRGDLPSLCGHQVDGARTRLTITSDTDRSGRTVWQLGGQIAEDGVPMEPAELVNYAATELAEVLPSLGLAGLEATTYRVDRAEPAMPGGRRPETTGVLVEGNTLTAWPTKLALVPVLTEQVIEHLKPGWTDGSVTPEFSPDWPRPDVALPPWETVSGWVPLVTSQTSRQAA